MALDLTPEQKAVGKANFEQTAGELARNGKMDSMVAGGGVDPKKPHRRDALKAALAAGAVVPVSAAVYFGYESWKGGNPVRTALIGTGDEGCVLVGDHNPEFNQIVAVCDIRPSNLKRVFEKDGDGPRKGLKNVVGTKAAEKIRTFASLDELLAAKGELKLEAVVVATPLNTHDVIVKRCLDEGLHVLCEKLMARTTAKCKAMIQYAKDKGLLLSVGHQRHYSTLYANAVEVVRSGVLGDIKHIKAQWPRNNSWPYLPSEAEKEKFATEYGLPQLIDGWYKGVLKEDAVALPPEKLAQLAFGNVNEYGFKDVAELVRWRLYDKTGGGLMAELGSHQLDASSIILGHVHPLAVQGVGGKFFYGPGKNDRESDDGVFVNYEFPGATYYQRDDDGHLVLRDGKPVPNPKGKDDVVVVSYASFNTNSFEKYGECVMGSRGTMIVEEERDVYLYKEPDKTKKGDPAAGGRDTKVSVGGAGGGKPALEASSTWGGAAGGGVTKTATGTAVWDSAVRGYRTEMEHFAYCVRKWQERGGKVDYAKDPKTGKLVHADIIPRCHGEVAMADAILALTANMAMDRKQRIVFEDAWFDPTSAEVPEAKYGKRQAQA
ncbi:MAG: Gfo/Idh/MocA family oxidoreductase [Gemmataceae bacterium]|nr:Gfo/Idh/MocA family oxidoreductase [Gemmataceae bacterium]